MKPFHLISVVVLLLIVAVVLSASPQQSSDDDDTNVYCYLKRGIGVAAMRDSTCTAQLSQSFGLNWLVSCINATLGAPYCAASTQDSVSCTNISEQQWLCSTCQEFVYGSSRYECSWPAIAASAVTSPVSSTASKINCNSDYLCCWNNTACWPSWNIVS
eukprot:TRINITY_DN1104_c0_g1_i1.p1 TRINITY_DN1104_c0_g1~~TRINITY_DN1104_c0_g1_i1.p1  ORF type:complete len:159 (+),score=17.91 TRINITY_DN1104_c0_g1_i1:469-945(+)